MRVAFINNMNNNHFAFVRYLRDMSIDAHLIIVDPLPEHFYPEADSFDDLTQCPYIHSYILPTHWSSYYFWVFRKDLKKVLANLGKVLDEFDLLIACGNFRWLEKIDRRVDVLLPYGSDLFITPFLEKIKTTWWKNILFFSWYHSLSSVQNNAIREARAIVTLANEDSNMAGGLKKLERLHINWALPMVYPLHRQASKIWDGLAGRDLIILSHTRQNWLNESCVNYKGSDKAIIGFSEFLKKNKAFKKPCLVLFEYGADVRASKNLVQELGIADYVLWMPKMQRKEIFAGIKKADLIFDILNPRVVSFGGVSFEAYAHGKPVIGNKKRLDGSYVDEMPVVHACTAEEVCDVLLDYEANPEKYKKIGADSFQWFQENVGLGLVKKYVRLFEILKDNPSLTLEEGLENNAELRVLVES